MHTPRIISNTEVSALLTCEAKWRYGHFLNLVPVGIGDTSRKVSGMILGTWGHDVLANFYGQIADGVEWEKAANNAKMYCYNTYVAGTTGDRSEQMFMLQTLLTRYFKFAENDEWLKILDVEGMYTLPINNDYSYGMRLDVLVQMKSGEIVIWDHKFLKRTYSDKAIAMNGQMPKYAAAVKAAGYNVRYCQLNMLKTGYANSTVNNKTDTELFTRVPVYTTPVESRTVMREQLNASRRIVQLREMDDETMRNNITRVRNTMLCGNCEVQPLCKAESQGQPINLMSRVEFRQNTYGYNNEGEN